MSRQPSFLRSHTATDRFLRKEIPDVLACDIARFVLQERDHVTNRYPRPLANGEATFTSDAKLAKAIGGMSARTVRRRICAVLKPAGFPWLQIIRRAGDANVAGTYFVADLEALDRAAGIVWDGQRTRWVEDDRPARPVDDRTERPVATDDGPERTQRPAMEAATIGHSGPSDGTERPKNVVDGRSVDAIDVACSAAADNGTALETLQSLPLFSLPTLAPGDREQRTAYVHGVLAKGYDHTRRLLGYAHDIQKKPPHKQDPWGHLQWLMRHAEHPPTEDGQQWAKGELARGEKELALKIVPEGFGGGGNGVHALNSKL